MRERLGDDRIERRALHGSRDLGDIYGIRAHGHEGVAECKDYKRWGKADLDAWKEQTAAERGNADADFSLLIVHEKGCGKARFGQNSCYMQVCDLVRVMGGDFRCIAGESAMETWVRVTLEDACQMIEGVYE
jgi:hypothetical protein